MEGEERVNERAKISAFKWTTDTLHVATLRYGVKYRNSKAQTNQFLSKETYAASKLIHSRGIPGEC